MREMIIEVPSASHLLEGVAMIWTGDVAGIVPRSTPGSTARTARAEVAKRKLLAPLEVAEILGVSLASAYRIIDADLVHVVVGEKGKRVPLSALDAAECEVMHRHGAGARSE